MSTKIYYAYRYDGNIQQLMKDLFRVRGKYWESCRENLKKWGGFSVRKFMEYEPIVRHLKDYHKKCLDEIDIVRKDKPIYEQHYSDIDYILQAHLRSGLNEPLNFQASVVVYPHGEDIYVQFFGVRELKKCLNKKFFDFHYQNQTDQPEEVTNKEWNHRKKVWDKIFKINDTPSMAGLVFPLIELDNCWAFCYWYGNKENPEKEK